jgi:hypothetical protein
MIQREQENGKKSKKSKMRPTEVSRLIYIGSREECMPASGDTT